jgi:hypothetical protein
LPNENITTSQPKTPKNAYFGTDNAENEGFGISSNQLLPLKLLATAHDAIRAIHRLKCANISQ